MPVAMLHCCWQWTWESVIILQSCQLIVLPSQGTICIPALMLAVIRGGVRGQLRKMQGYRNKEIMDADLQSFDEGMTTLANRRSVIEASLIQLCAHYQLSTYRAGAGRVLCSASCSSYPRSTFSVNAVSCMKSLDRQQAKSVEVEWWMRVAWQIFVQETGFITLH